MRSTFGKIFQKSLIEAASVRDCLIPLSKREERARFGRGKAATFYAQAACLSVPVVLVSANHSYPQLSTAKARHHHRVARACRGPAGQIWAGGKHPGGEASSDRRRSRPRVAR